MSDITDLLVHAVGKNPVEFSSAFDNLMRLKASEAIENHRTMLAQSIYNTAEDNDVYLEDIDLEDIDLEDLDLEDLDLEDIDLDDTTYEDTTDEDA
jgi:uncharacterized protein YjbI with pentapeptide repeats